MALSWRPATEADLDHVDRIGNEIHAELPERPEVFAEKFKLFPHGCFVLTLQNDIVGYGIAHPWMLFDIPPLDTLLGTLPADPQCLFIHDVVVKPEARGRGATETLIDSIADLARQRKIPSLALVSVYNTHPLWERYGFEVVTEPALKSKLKSYGPSARYMVRRLT